MPRTTTDLRWAVAASTLACARAMLLSVVAVARADDGIAAVATPRDVLDEIDFGAVDRSPVDLALTPDERFLLTANRTSGTVSLVEIASGSIRDEVPCGRWPAAIALSPDGRRAYVTSQYTGELRVFDVADDGLKAAGQVDLGRFEPRGVAVTADGRTAYVALSSGAAVAVVDLQGLALVDRIDVGRWPRSVALSPDGSRLAVGCDGERSIAVVDTAARRMLYQEKYGGINAGLMQVSADNQYVYFPWMIYRTNPITDRNIRLGWVLASRIARVRLDGPARREAISLDPPGKAISDPYGMALTSDEQWMVASAPGTHELLVYRLPGLPFVGAGGPGDHIDRALLADPDRFHRIELGGRPMAVRLGRDDRTAYVVNYLSNAVQVVDIADRQVTREITLGGPESPSLARRGEAIFYDGRRSLDQWYSCHSCHFEGGTNAVTMDTLNDGTIRTNKTVLSLVNVTRTPPWTWHGWQEDLPASVHKSITETMLGPEPTREDAEAVVAFLDTLEYAPNPYREADGGLTEAALRGQQVFESDKAGCANCHNGPYFSDGAIHDVGLGSPKDVYQGFNTPSLLGAHHRLLFLHHGRAKSLEDVVTDLHSPGKVTGMGELNAEEVRDLVEYLKSL
jgi:YVTN family beta-propeller protein